MNHSNVNVRWLLLACISVVGLSTVSGQTPTAPDDPTQATSPPADSAKGDRDQASETAKVALLANQRFSQAEGKAGLCDVYCPDCEPPAGGHPVVVVVHGGGWISGDKWTVEGYSRLLARHGFVVVTINYRLAPKYKFPAQVDDVREALLWTCDNAERFSINLERFGMFGYSAGGHLSTLVASLADEPLTVQAAASDWAPDDPRWEKLPSIRAVCIGGPPCDFRTLPIDNTALAYFLGGSRRELPGIYEAASPTAHVSAADPATQIIHGEGDLLVPIGDSLRLHQAQKKAGVDSRFQRIPKQGHMLTFLNPQTSKTMLAFFQEILQTQQDHADSKNEQESATPIVNEPTAR